jgi:protein phosphatase
MATEVAVEVQPSSVLHADGDVLVLCSDGLSDLVGALEISRAVTASPPALAAQQLIDLANSRGGFDNVTVAIVRARATALASLDGATRVALGATETMPAFHTPSTRPEAPEDVRVRGPSVAPPSNQPLLPHAPPPSHPHRVARRVARRASPAVLVGLVLALVGVAAVVAVVTLEVVPHGQRNPVPGLSLSIVLPAATLVPAGPAVDEDVDAGVDAAPRGHRFRNPKRK